MASAAAGPVEVAAGLRTVDVAAGEDFRRDVDLLPLAQRDRLLAGVGAKPLDALLQRPLPDPLRRLREHGVYRAAPQPVDNIRRRVEREHADRVLLTGLLHRCRGA